jgi:heptosyltransferase-1
VKRILIVRVGAMGDVLHGLPAVAALREQFPDAEIGWVVEPAWAALLGAPVVDRVHLARTKAWSKAPLSGETLRDVKALRAELRAAKYDVAIDLQGSIRSAVIARMSGAKRVVGSAEPREGAAKWLYTGRVALRSAHVIDQAVEIVSGAASETLRAAEVVLPRDAQAERWADALAGEETLAMIAPRAGWGAKEWPAERYGAVAAELAQRGLRVLVNALPATAERGGDAVAAAVVTASGGRAEAVESTLPQLIALTRRAKLFLGGDTGPMHLAAALRVPCVAIFGPTDPARNGPYDVMTGACGTTARVLRDAGSVTDHRRHAVTEEGMLRVSVESVVRAAREVMESA